MDVSRDIATAVIVACWGAVILAWIVAAAFYARQSGRVRERKTGGTVPFGFILVVFVALLPIHWRFLPLRLFWLQLAGAAILVISSAFSVWARLSLGPMWSVTATAREGHELRTTGPYAVTRHPIYTGLTGMLLGSTLLSGSGTWVPILVAGGALLWTKSTTEERLMAETFGEDYERYRKRVPRLVPWPRPRVSRDRA
jgi:protein-S-isoprenylcysteine O-methyltransferase Ste14